MFAPRRASCTPREFPLRGTMGTHKGCPYDGRGCCSDSLGPSLNHPVLTQLVDFVRAVTHHLSQNLGGVLAQQR